jgi:hypothetical protein
MANYDVIDGALNVRTGSSLLEKTFNIIRDERYCQVVGWKCDSHCGRAARSRESHLDEDRRW